MEETEIVYKFTKTDHTCDEIRELLNHLPQEYCDDYAKWNKVGMTLFSLSEDYKDLFLPTQWQTEFKKDQEIGRNTYFKISKLV